MTAPMTQAAFQQRAERMGATLRLAVEIADECARSDIETMCPFQSIRGLDWYDLNGMFDDDDATRRLIDKAARYLRMRGRLVQHPTAEHLVRFGV